MQQLVLSGLVVAFNVLTKISVGSCEIRSSKNDADEDSYFLGCCAVPTVTLPCFEGAKCFHVWGQALQKDLTLTMKELLSSETSVPIYQETRRYQPIIIKNLQGVRLLGKGVRPSR